MQTISENLAVDLAVRIANTRSLWLYTIATLMRRGLVTDADVADMRDNCLDAAGWFADSDDRDRREFGQAGIEDLAILFGRLLP